jgi:hypothetical protein
MFRHDAAMKRHFDGHDAPLLNGSQIAAETASHTCIIGHFGLRTGTASLQADLICRGKRMRRLREGAVV